MGKHCIKSWSKTQHNITTSSAEAEAIAVVKATSEAVAVSRMCSEFGTTLVTCIYIDASAAIGILEREGVGKIRHIDVGVLWLQQKHLRQDIGFHKIDGTKNPADLMTKGLSAEHITRYVE